MRRIFCARVQRLHDVTQVCMDDVCRCLCQYERRVGRKCFTQTKSPSHDVTGEVATVGSCSDQDEGQPAEQGSGDRQVSSVCDEAAPAPSAESTDAGPSISPSGGEDGVHRLKGISPSNEETMQAGSLTIGKESCVVNSRRKALVNRNTRQPESTDTDHRLHQPKQSTLDSNPEKVKNVRRLTVSHKSPVGIQDSASLVSRTIAPAQHSSESQKQTSEINSSSSPVQHSSESQEEGSKLKASIDCIETQKTVPDSAPSVKGLATSSQQHFSEGPEQEQRSSESSEQVPEATSLPSHSITLAQHSTEGQEPVADSPSSTPNVVAGDTASTGKEEEELGSIIPVKRAVDRDAQSTVTEGTKREECLGGEQALWLTYAILLFCEWIDKKQ